MNKEHLEFIALMGGVFIQYEQFEKARKCYNLLRVLQPEDSRTAMALSYLDFKCGRHEAAVSQADRVLAHSTDDEHIAVGHLIKSKALWALNCPEAARENWRAFKEKGVA